MGKYQFVQIQEPAYNERCWDTVRKPDVKEPCPSATPPQSLTIGVGTAFAKAHPDLIQFFEKVQLTGDQINAAILRMNERKISGEVMAREFLKANPKAWESWVPAPVAARVRASLN
jgi:glycine betaine/proline transport system substrate-binding protein